MIGNAYHMIQKNTCRQNRVRMDRWERNTSTLKRKVRMLSDRIESSRLADYISYLEKPRRMLAYQFAGGLLRGFGIAIGFSLLGALALYILRQVALANLPGLGKFISDIIQLVESNMH